MAEPKNPLAEVFGFPISNKTERALHYQENRLCPFNNVVPSCTKVSEVDPLGVCSLFDRDDGRLPGALQGGLSHHGRGRTLLLPA